MLILFSGTAGMGKHTLAQEIEKQLQAIRISHAGSAELLKQAGIHHKYINEYMNFCLQELKKISFNQTIILDCSSDSKYHYYQNFAKENHYHTFLIRLNASKESALNLYKKRFGPTAPLDRFMKEYKEYAIFPSLYLIDHTFELEKPHHEELYRLIEAIKKPASPNHQVQPGYMRKYAPARSLYQQIRGEILAARHNKMSAYNPHADRKMITRIIPGLYLGSEEGCKVLSEPWKMRKWPSKPQVTHVLSCLKDFERPRVMNFTWKNLYIDDLQHEKIFHFFDQTYDYIEKAHDGIFVHCKQGISRSATIVVAYLMKKFDVPYDDALGFVRTKRPYVNPNAGFRTQLKEYERYLKLKKKEAKKLALVKNKNSKVIKGRRNFALRK